MAMASGMRGARNRSEGRIAVKSRKGPEFEREVAKDLSLWWTAGDRDDIFWRTQNSGGRATARKRKGKTTQGQYGDIQAVDPLGKPLMRFLSFELKRGYDVGLDGIFKRKQTSFMLPGWIRQAEMAADDAESYAWALVVKRNFHPRLLFCPERVFKAIGHAAYEIVDKVWFECKDVAERVMVVRLDDFLKRVDAGMVMDAIEKVGLDV